VPLRNVGPGNLGQLGANATHIFWVANTPAGNELKAYEIAGEKEELVLKGVQGYALNDSGDKLAFRVGQGIGIADAKPGQDASKVLDVSKFELRIDPVIEWRQMYVDAWRILRDWFYDEGVHGNDWNAIRARYEPLVAHVSNREDLDYILHEVAGELNAGHVYVERGANRPSKVTRREGGLLGAEISASDYGYFRIDRIYAGQNWSEDFRSPLTAAGVGIQAGDWLIAIDGTSTREVKNIYALLENKGNRMVELTVNERPDADGARTVRVRTITSETGLRYLDWVESRRQLVERLSGGRIGYVHVPNTAVEGNRELVKQMMWQTGKEALIIDDRYNGGGFIPDRMIEILSRRPLNYWKRRGLDPQATPLFSHDGPKAMLINGLSSSGGDALPYYFRKMGLGPLIGTRTWGGLIGISGNPGLMDGSQILAATFRFMDTDGQWAVENEGVAPDIEVLDRPELVAKGKDPGVEKAVEVLLKELDAKPRRKVTAPQAPADFGRP
jgi:tricorn protease